MTCQYARTSINSDTSHHWSSSIELHREQDANHFITESSKPLHRQNVGQNSDNCSFVSYMYAVGPMS